MGYPSLGRSSTVPARMHPHIYWENDSLQNMIGTKWNALEENIRSIHVFDYQLYKSCSSKGANRIRVTKIELPSKIN